MKNKRNKARRQASLVLTALSVPVGLSVLYIPATANAQDLDDFIDGPVAKLADKDLAEQRGGLKLSNGLQVRFAVDITRRVNGSVTRRLQAVLDRPYDKDVTVAAFSKPSQPKDPVEVATNTVAANLAPQLSDPHDKTAPKQGNTPDFDPIALIEKAASVTLPAGGQEPPQEMESFGESGDAVDSLTLLQNALNGHAVIVNDQSNVHIVDVTQVTIDIANYSSFASLAGQAGIGAQTLNLIQSTLAAGLSLN